MRRGSILLSSWNGRDRVVLPGSVPHVQQAGGVGRGWGRLSSRFLLFFILFLLSSRFGSPSSLFLFHKPVSEIVFLRYSDRLCLVEMEGTMGIQQGEVRRVSGDSHCFFFLYCAW